MIYLLAFFHKIIMSVFHKYLKISNSVADGQILPLQKDVFILRHI